MEIQQKKDLIERIRRLTDPVEQRQLLRILLKNKVKYTENSNGCFINLANVHDSIINKLLAVVKMCEQNREYHKKMNNLLEEARKNVDDLYERKLTREQDNREDNEEQSDEEESDDESDDEQMRNTNEQESEQRQDYEEESDDEISDEN